MREFGLTKTEERVFRAIPSEAFIRLQTLADQTFSHLDEPKREAILKIHIFNMRPKLKAHGIGILTVYRLGYRVLPIDQMPTEEERVRLDLMGRLGLMLTKEKAETFRLLAKNNFTAAEIRESLRCEPLGDPLCAL